MRGGWELLPEALGLVWRSLAFGLVSQGWGPKGLGKVGILKDLGLRMVGAPLGRGPLIWLLLLCE